MMKQIQLLVKVTMLLVHATLMQVSVFFQVLAILLAEQVRNNGDLVAIEFENNWARNGPLLFGGLAA